MKKRIMAFSAVLFVFSLLYAKDFTQIKKGDSKENVVKVLGNPNRSFSDSDGEYDIWIDGDKIWLISFTNNEVYSEPVEIEEMITSLLELKNIFSDFGELSDTGKTEDLKTVEEKPDTQQELINKIELTVVECKIYESWSGDNKLGYRIKLKNRSDKEISEVVLVTYFRDKEGNIFYEDTVKAVSSSDSVKFKPNYSLFYPESSNSYHPITGIDLEEWDGGKVDFVIDSITVK